MDRRSFIAAPLGVAAFQHSAPTSPTRVYAYGDGVPHSPAEYARLLTTLSSPAEISPDDYSRGGAVAALEAHMAQALGKEAAVWFPTGTLANQVAVRMLAGARRRVLVQAESHLYKDCGDCCQTLSNLTLVPLAPGKSTFTLDDVEHAANDSMTGRVATPVGAIQIESPVRRMHGERFDFEQMQRISAWARKRNIGLHLDGARLFLESAYTKRPVKDYAALFDTVYVSMYKYFNAASGAVLAGPKDRLKDLYHTRRMFGGGLPQVWPFAAVALHFAHGFEQRLARGVEISEKVISILAADRNFEVQRVPNGTNIFMLRVDGVNAPIYNDRLETAGISARTPTGVWFNIQVNETWARVPAQEIARRFQQAYS